MKFTVTTQFFNHDKRGNAKLVKAGTVLTQSDYNKLTPQKKVKCEELIQVRKNVPYNEEEMITLIDSHVNNGNRQSVILEFLQKFSETKHSQSSLNRMCGQLETIDIRHPNSINHVVSSKLIEIASNRYPERFGTIEEIRQINLINQAEKILSELIG